jgi:hypothetical protein
MYVQGHAPSHDVHFPFHRIAHEVRSTSGWVSLLGWVTLIAGIGYAVTIVGLIIAWLPMWIGISLISAGSAGKRLAETGNPEDLVTYLAKIRVYFAAIGVILAMSLVVLVGSMLLFGGTILALAGAAMSM